MIMVYKSITQQLVTKHTYYTYHVQSQKITEKRLSLCVAGKINFVLLSVLLVVFFSPLSPSQFTSRTLAFDSFIKASNLLLSMFFNESTSKSVYKQANATTTTKNLHNGFPRMCCFGSIG